MKNKPKTIQKFQLKNSNTIATNSYDMLVSHDNKSAHILEKKEIDFNIEVNAKEYLMLAIRNNQIDLVRTLLTKLSSVNFVDSIYLTPLQAACMFNRVEIVRILIENGADINVSTITAVSPIEIANNFGFTELKQMLLQYQAVETMIRNQLNYNQQTTLHTTKKKQFYRKHKKKYKYQKAPKETTVEINHKSLFNNKTKPDVEPCYKFSLLFDTKNKDFVSLLRENNENISTLSSKYIQMIEYLINDDHPLPDYDEFGSNFLHDLTELDNPHREDINFIKFLIETFPEKIQAIINNYTLDGYTALHCLAKSGLWELLEDFKELGCCLGQRTIFGDTPLHLAVFYKHDETASKLIDIGVAPEPTNNLGENILHIACEKGNIEIIKKVISLLPRYTIEKMLKAKNINGFTPKDLASQNYHSHILELFSKLKHTKHNSIAYDNPENSPTNQNILFDYAEQKPQYNIPSTEEAINSQINIDFIGANIPIENN